MNKIFFAKIAADTLSPLLARFCFPLFVLTDACLLTHLFAHPRKYLSHFASSVSLSHFVCLSVCLCLCVCVCLKTAVWCLFAVGLLVVVRLLPVGNVCAPSVTQSDRSLSVYNDGCTKSTRVRLENSESPFGNDISDANGTLDANEEREASSACLCAWGQCTMSVLFFFLSEAQF